MRNLTAVAIVDEYVHMKSAKNVSHLKLSLELSLKLLLEVFWEFCWVFFLALGFLVSSLSFAGCIDIHPPRSIGFLVLGEPVPQIFVEQFSPIPQKEMDSWFEAGAFDYRVVDGKISIIQFTPAKYRGCVTLNKKPLAKNWKFERYGKNLKDCKKGPLAKGGSSYLCPGFEVQASSATATWPDPIFRIDDEIAKRLNTSEKK